MSRHGVVSLVGGGIARRRGGLFGSCLALVVYDQEGEEHDACSDPVHRAGILALEDNLPDEGKGDGQTEADGYD